MKVRDRIRLPRPEAPVRKPEEQEIHNLRGAVPPNIRFAGIEDQTEQSANIFDAKDQMAAKTEVTAPGDHIGAADNPENQSTESSSPEANPLLGAAFSVTGNVAAGGFATDDRDREAVFESLREQLLEEPSFEQALALTRIPEGEGTTTEPEPKAPVEVEAPQTANVDTPAPTPEPPPQAVGNADQVTANMDAQAESEMEEAEANPEELSGEKKFDAPTPPDPNAGQGDGAAEQPETPAAEVPQRRQRGNGSNLAGLPDNIRSSMERVFAIDLSSVNIRQNSSKATEVGALAFARGNEIHFAPGQFSPGTPSGQNLLGHELAHLVQQREGRVRSTGERQGVQVNTDAALEAEADRMAQAALNGPSLANLTDMASADAAETALAQLTGAPSGMGIAQLQDDGTGGGNTFAAYEEMLQWAEQKKSSIRENTTTLKQQVTQAGETQKQAIQTLLDTAIQTMRTAIEGAITKITDVNTGAKDTVNSHRQTKVQEITSLADTEIQAIMDMIQAKKDIVNQRAQQKTGQLTSHAETEAQRAINESSTNAGQVDTIITQTAAQYGDREGIDEARTEAQNNAGEMRTRFTQNGNDMAQLVRTDASGMVTEIQTEATQVAAEFDKPLAECQTKINQKKDETVTALDGTATSFTTTLDSESQESLTALRDQIPQQEQSMRSFASGTNETVDKSVTDIHAVIDREMEKALTDVDAFVEQIAEIGWHSQEVQAAQQDLDAAVEAHNQEVNTFISDSQAKYTEHQGQVTQETNNLNQQIQTTLDSVTTDYETEVNTKRDEVTGEMDTMATESSDQIRTVRTNLEPELDEAVEEVDGKWDESLQTAETEISNKINTGLEGQRSALSDFSGRINTEFSNLPSRDRGFLEGLWDGITSIGEFIGGIFVGLLEGLWEMLKGIWDIIVTPAKWLMAAVVIIVAVIVIAIVAAVAGISFGLAALIVGAIIGIGFMAYYIYQAVTTEGLSPYDRGRLVGRGLFEGIMGFVGTGLLGRLAGWASRIARLSAVVSKVGGLNNFLRMAVWVDDIERLINVINRVDNIGQMASVFGRLSDARDAAKLLELIDSAGDVGRVMNYLGDGSNVSRLLSYVDDVSKVGPIMDKVGDSATLIRIMEAGGFQNLSQLDSLLTHFDDIGRMESLLTRVDDAAQLTALIDRVGDVGKLESLLTRCDNGAQLTSLLDEVGDADRLAVLLDRTGSGAAAQRFLQQLRTMEQRLLDSGLTRIDDGNGVVRYLDNTGQEIARMDDFTMRYSYGGHGGDIIMDPNRTTTILGKFQDPTTPGWGTEWVHNMPEGSFSRQGSNPGGLNMLDVDPQTWDNLLAEVGGDEAARIELFWQRYNLPFLEQSFKNGDIIRLLSDPSNPAARTGTYARELAAVEGPTGFAQRYGYIWDAATNSYRPGPNWSPTGALNAADNTVGAVDNAVNASGNVVNATDNVINAAESAVNGSDNVANSVDNVANTTDNVANTTDNVANTADNMANTVDNAAANSDNAAGLLDENGRFRQGPGGAGFVDAPQSQDAARFYERMEALTDGTDVVNIANNNGFTQSVVQRVHNHLFVQPHTIHLENAAGEIVTATGKFAPFDDIARLWERAMSGALPPQLRAELRDLLAHEYLESRLMSERGLPYRTRASVADGMPNPQHIPDNGFGAHDLSANDKLANQNLSRLNSGFYTAEDLSQFTHFRHWENFFGIRYQGPEIAQDLSNLDSVFEYIVTTLGL